MGALVLNEKTVLGVLRSRRSTMRTERQRSFFESQGSKGLWFQRSFLRA